MLIFGTGKLSFCENHQNLVILVMSNQIRTEFQNSEMCIFFKNSSTMSIPILFRGPKSSKLAFESIQNVH
jgi:hypothetical protein